MERDWQTEIDSAVRAITLSIQPERIYLFGSYANNTARTDSDIDLCVIADLGGMRKIEALRKIRRAIMTEVNLPVDLLVYDHSEFNNRSILPSTMEHRIATEGKILYEQ